MQWKRSLVIALTCGAVLTAAIVGLWLWSRNDAVLGTLGLVGAIVLFVRGELDRHFDDRPVALDESARRVAAKVTEYWEGEVRRRRHNDVNAMPSRWQRSALGPRVAEDIPSAGDSHELVTLYCERPVRLILLGGPGSGKTTLCVRLTLALSETEAPRRVPVLMQLASWNRKEDLGAWMAGQLRAMHGVSRPVARALVDSHRILPVLDGLDEEPDASIATALQALQASWRKTDPFVLACGERAFDDAGSDLIGRDMEVRILPVDSGDVANALVIAADGRPGWTRVIDEVRDHPDRPVARALNTRLMLILMARVFDVSAAKPQDLLDDRRLATADRVRDHLIDLFLARAYRNVGVKEFRDADRTQRWLEFVATRLCSPTDRRLSWWRFDQAVERPIHFTVVRIAVGTVVTGALCLIMFGLYGRPLLGLLFGTGLGIAGGAAMGLPQPGEPSVLPRALRNSEEGLVPAVISAVIAGLGAGVAIGMIYRDAAVGLIAGTVIGLGFGSIRRLLTTASARTARVLGPEEVLRHDRRTVLESFLLGGLVAGAVGAGLGLLGEADRLGIVIPLHSRVEEVLIGAGVGALAGSFALAMIFHSISAWGRLLLTRLILYWRGDTPLRLMRFLRVSEQAGVLRRLGPQYEFHNEMLRARLVTLAGQRGRAPGR